MRAAFGDEVSTGLVVVVLSLMGFQGAIGKALTPCSGLQLHGLNGLMSLSTKPRTGVCPLRLRC